MLPAESGPRPGELDYFQFKVAERETGPAFVEGGGFASTKIVGGHGNGAGATAGVLYGGGIGTEVEGVGLHAGWLHERIVGFETGQDGKLHAVDESDDYLNLEAGVGPAALGVLINDKGIAAYKSVETSHGVHTGDGFSVVLPETLTDDIVDTLKFVGERMHD